MTIFKLLKQFFSSQQATSTLKDELKSKNPVKNYLYVPHKQKDIVKELGAKWDDNKKQWFIFEDDDQSLFEKWLPSITGNLKANYFYLAQTQGRCFKCKNKTLRNAIVLPEGFMSLQEDVEDVIDEEDPNYNPAKISTSFYPNDYFSLLSYIDYISTTALKEIQKQTDNYDLCYSHTIDAAYFMSKCHNCQAAQGDHFSMIEHNSPFKPVDVENFSKLKFEKILIPIEIYAASVGIGYPPIEYYLGDTSVNGLFYARSFS